MSTHHAFGLSLELEEGIEAGELPEGSGAAGPPTHVRLAAQGELDARWPAERARTTREVREAERLLLAVARAPDCGYLLTIPALGRFLISIDGDEVACEPAAQDWIRALTAQALPLAATVRGLEPFHASAVVFDGSALAIAGAGGLGKTSLAAHLVGAGAELLTDDVLVVEPDEDGLRAHPGAGWLRLRSAEAGRVLALYGGRFQPVRPGDERAQFAVPSCDEHAPLRALYLLRRGTTTPLDIEPLEAVPPAELLGATYNLSVREPDRLNRQLDLCQRLARVLPIFRLHVRPGVGAESLASRVADHFRALTA